jgi:hypothetical protein
MTKEIDDAVLKECPFCWGKATRQTNVINDNGAKIYETGCDNVGCLVLPSARGLTQETADEYWNTRATPPQLQKSCSDLKDVQEALDKLFHYHGFTSWHVTPDKQKEVWDALKTIRTTLMSHCQGWTKQDSLDVIQDAINLYTNKLFNENGGRETKAEQRFAIQALNIIKNEIVLEKRAKVRHLKGNSPTPPETEE